MGVRGLIDLTDRVRLRFTGADRLRFLNGQLTNDLRRLEPGRAMAACALTAKGKLCADVRVALDGEGIRVDADGALAEGLVARFERYIIADDVAVEEMSGVTRQFHLVGVEAVEGGVAAVRYGVPGFDLVVGLEEGAALWEEWSGRVPVLGPEAAERLRVERGVPRWGFELGEETLPAEAGLDAVAVDFHKGCYLGQEVVSRIKSVGHVNRRLAGFVAGAPGGAFAAGAELAGAGGEIAGRLTSVAGELGLGFLKRGAGEGPFVARREGFPDCIVAVRPLPLAG
jgi:folate-binding protein YgfZ